MSQIEKLQIQGIRSYKEPAVIEFFTPLTLIVGTNGAGKTTIIEALNYITTGDMPPNSKGAAFVFDPKVAGSQEVKGQVKLMLKDMSGHRIIATRSLVSTQKAKKVECKSLENVIKRNINQEWHQISSKCADINKEMVTCLGVSKAVLDCVIFCHQEDSLWPLSEGKVLKTKFDDIFAATRYIKALEAIRKLRKEQVTEVKKFKTELDYLKANKDKADEIAESMEKSSEQLENAQQKVDELNNSITPVETRLRDLSKVQKTLNEFERKLDILLSRKKSLVEMNKDIAGKITNFFQGSKQDLETFAREFESKVKNKETQLIEVEDNVRLKDRNYSELSSEKNSILVNHGKLQQEAARHESNIKQRDAMIVRQSDTFQFEGFDSPPFSSEKVTQFKEATKIMYQKMIQDGKDSKQAYQKRIGTVQSTIDDIKKTLYQYEETIRIKTNLLSENQRKLKQVGKDLSNVDASAKKLQRTEKELNAAEKDLEDTKASGNVLQWKTELEKSQKEKRQFETELSRLREEQQTMHLNSTTQAKLDMFRKQKEAKEDAIQKVIDKHEEELRTMFGSCGPTDTLKPRVSSFLKEKRTEVKNTTINIQKLKQQQSSKQAEQRMTLDEIEKLENVIAGYEKKLQETCGDEEYDTLKENLYNGIEQAKSKCSQLSAFETIFKKYITTMEEKKKEPCCPLCHRQFDTLKDMQKLVNELKDKIHRVPEKMAAQQNSLERDEKMYEQLQKLRSVKDNLEEYKNTKLPSAKEKLSEVSQQCEELQNKIEELEDVRAVIESEESSAGMIEPDLVMLEENQKSLKSLDKEISLLQAKVQGVAPGRSMQLVTNEISDCQDRVDGLNRVIDRKRNQISQQESRIATLTSNVHELNSEKLRLSGELQRRSHLEEQKAELTAVNMENEREIKEAKRQLEPVRERLDEHENQYKSLSNEQQEQVEKTNAKLNEIKSYSLKFKDKMDEIRAYIDENRASELDNVEGELKSIEEKIQIFNEERKKLISRLDILKDDLSKRKVRSRELQDNMKFVENEENVSKLEDEINTIRSEQERVGDINKLQREQNNLSRRLEEYRKQKATCEGMQTGLEREITRFQKELQDPMFKDADSKHRNKLIEIKTTEMANDDLDKYYKALDRAIMKFHSIKMAEINKIVKEYWINTYKGNDIDTIEIRSDEDPETSSIAARRSYNYKVVMLKDGVALDMRGRCSAGQKVLASLIIRLALAESFCLNCGILTLDEPTTNLDDENIESLASQLSSIVSTRNPQKNFQLVVITHDEHFVDLLSQGDFVEYYYRVAKDEGGISRIYKQSTSGVQESS
ncbi:DNA repair protein RAD50-like [Dendronephthya gigantea]|uniref:DNA repair protein RAD50-like n=1 Tax=Dendronephthya gigantea TaxID=151771 RepID=UPI001069844F|nr:DNA repair protein RAD50-like [Dendronephthya gigantea]